MGAELKFPPHVEVGYCPACPADWQNRRCQEDDCNARLHVVARARPKGTTNDLAGDREQLYLVRYIVRHKRKMTGLWRDVLMQYLFLRWTRKRREITLNELYTRLSDLGLFEGFTPTTARTMISISLGLYHPELAKPHGIVVDEGMPNERYVRPESATLSELLAHKRMLQEASDDWDLCGPEDDPDHPTFAWLRDEIRRREIAG
jgi:hypothetical protein